MLAQKIDDHTAHCASRVGYGSVPDPETPDLWNSPTLRDFAFRVVIRLSKRCHPNHKSFLRQPAPTVLVRRFPRSRTRL
jgi:hypothetical protein